MRDNKLSRELLRCARGLTGGLMVDGKPFLPFGVYCGPVGKLPDQEVLHGFNMIGPYQSNFP